MSRPQGIEAGQTAGDRIDATLVARAGTTIERNYVAADLPRLLDAGALAGSKLTACMRFSEVDGRVALDGRLDGAVMLVCQRCLAPVQLPLQERFKVLLAQDEAGLDQEAGDYEVILADPARFDVRQLVEDQALLGLPLVPRHAAATCNEAQAPLPESDGPAEAGSGEEPARQRSLGNLRDLLRKH